MKKILLGVMMLGCFAYTSVGFGYSVQPGDNTLLSKIYDRIDTVYKNDHTKLLAFSDEVFSQELRFAKTDQSKYFFSKIKEYINGKLYTFVDSPEFVCLQERIQYGDSTTITYKLQYEEGFVDMTKGTVMQTPSDTPLLFNAGKGQVIAGIDKAVLGNMQGKTYGVVIEPREGRGNIQSSMIVEYPTEVLLQKYEILNVNDRVQVGVEIDDVQKILQATILAVGAETTTLDLNHLLAGETLLGVYTIENLFKACRE